MNKNYKTKLPYLILTAAVLFFCWLFCIRNGVFGSRVDWISQHSVLSDYFRQLFYSSGQLCPEFAANIGGGQNIYNFSYYGLYSPVILISYLLPWVDMGTYIMAAMIISLVVAVLLFYRWLLQRGISNIVSIFVALLFMLSGPMIYHSYNQIMFVNYMPFLCLALIGVDRYFEKQKVGLYIFSVWMMIMTSFYFSIGGMLVLVIYGIYRYIEAKMNAKQKIEFMMFLKDGIQFLFPMFIAVLMSAILLVPTACVLMGGRSAGSGESVSLWKLFIPHIKLSGLLYKPYGIGLTTLVITVTLSGLIYKKCAEKWLHIASIIVLTIPIFAWFLNGGLYIRDKVMIPFIPLLCFMIAKYIEKQRKGEISFREGLIPFIITILIVCIARKPAYLADAIIMALCFGLCYRKKCMQFLIVPSLVILIVHGVVYQEESDMSIEPDLYAQVTDENNKALIDKIVKEESGFYRMEQNGSIQEDAANINRAWSTDQYLSSVYSSVYNKEYQSFRTEIFKTDQPYRNILMQPCAHNPVFQRLMGIKYLISDTDIPGYMKIAENVYENDDVLPIAYQTQSVISEEEYRKLEFPYNQLALLEYAVVDDNTGEHINTENLNAGLQEVDMLFEDFNYVMEIPEADEGDIFFLQFKVNNHCPSEDVSVWVEGVRNKLTAESHIYYNGNDKFTYAVPLKEGQTSINIKFGAGDYELEDDAGYIWKKSVYEGQKNELVQSEFIVNKQETKGNIIKGTLQVNNDDGYLITSIPYDKNFEILVDGKKAAYEKVNTAFLGLKIQEGKHEVEIIYHAPGLMIGKILSLIGLILFVLIIRLKWKRKQD